MKILKIVLISIIALVFVLAVAAVIFIKTFDVNRFKPQIISQAKNALNREVDFQKASLDISFKAGINLKITGLVIAENPAFQKGDFLKVKEIAFGVDVLGYLFRKKVNISAIFIAAPRVTIIRQKDGSLNLQSFGKPAEAATNVQASAQAPAQIVLPAILISSLKLTDGTVNYIDRSFEPALALEVSDLNVTVNKLSLTEPFPFIIEAAVLSAKKNIRLEGKLGIDLKTNTITISALKGATELSELIPEKIPQALPIAKGAVLPVNLKGKVSVMFDKITAGPQGIAALTGDASLTNGILQFKELAAPIKDIVANVQITKADIILDKTSAAIGEGKITCSGKIEDYPAKQVFSIQSGIENLKLQDLIAQDKSPVKAEGVVSGQLSCTGEGFTPEALQSNLSGKADISVTKAKLKEINVLRTVLDKISLIPGLAQTLEAGLPERYKQKLMQQDTVFSDIKLPVKIGNSRIIITDTVLASDEFIFKGKGEAGFDGAYSLEGAFLIPEELSASMVTAVSQLQYLLNENNQIYIPLKISGRAQEVKFNVDAQYIAQRLLETQAKQQIFKAIDKILGTKEPNATGQNDQQQSGSDNKSDVKGAISNILDNIFKK